MRSASGGASSIVTGSGVPGTIGTPTRSARLARGLVAHHLDGLGRRPDERDAGLFDGAGELGALGQEPVAGVNHGWPSPCGPPPGWRRSTGRTRRGAADRSGTRGRPSRRGARRGPRRSIRPSTVAELAHGADDADGDLTAVRDQDARFGHGSAPAPDNRGPQAERESNLRCFPNRRFRARSSGIGAYAPVRFDEVTGSTQATALEMADDGAPEWTLVAAGHQTAGRGRQGRLVAQPAHALLFSIVRDPPRAGLDRHHPRWRYALTKAL